jgi:hypothetical protein
MPRMDQPHSGHHRREWTYGGHSISTITHDDVEWYKCSDLAKLWGNTKYRQQQNELMPEEIRVFHSSGAMYVTGAAAIHLARPRLNAKQLGALFAALGSGTSTVVPGPRKNKPCPFTKLEKTSKPRRITQVIDDILHHAGVDQKTQPVPTGRGKPRQGKVLVSNDTTQLLAGVLNRLPVEETAKIVGLLDETTGGILPHIIKPFARDIEASLETAWFYTKVQCSISDRVYQTQVKPLFGPASKALGLQVTIPTCISSSRLYACVLYMCVSGTCKGILSLPPTLHTHFIQVLTYTNTQTHTHTDARTSH